MPEIRKKYDREFRDGAVRIVEETGKPIAQVARDLGVNEGTVGNWVLKAQEARDGTEGLSRGDIEEHKRPRGERRAADGARSVDGAGRLVLRQRRRRPVTDQLRDRRPQPSRGTGNPPRFRGNYTWLKDGEPTRRQVGQGRMTRRDYLPDCPG